MKEIIKDLEMETKRNKNEEFFSLATSIVVKHLREVYGYTFDLSLSPFNKDNDCNNLEIKHQNKIFRFIITDDNKFIINALIEIKEDLNESMTKSTIVTVASKCFKNPSDAIYEFERIISWL